MTAYLLGFFAIIAWTPIQADGEGAWTERGLYGFTIQIERGFPWNRETENAYRFLGKALRDFHLALPPEQATNLLKRPIMLSDKKGVPPVCYQPGRERIAIYDLAEFYRSSRNRNGSPLITQFAREYYDLYLSQKEKREIADGYRNARELYAGEKAGKDAISYFAQLTTAYFGIAETAPADYHALSAFDLRGFSLMEAIWGERGLKAYLPLEIEGFRVMYPIRYRDKPELAEALRSLRDDLARIARVVPEEFVNLFRRKILWLDHTNQGAACHHNDIGWLLTHGVIREKCNCVEISNMEHYVQWRKQNQPMMLLHEFAHLYHQSSYSKRREIPDAYRNAMEHHLYDEVSYFSGSGYLKKRAYAATNPFEYFAEITEAYFGKNDFYPFQREDLRKHDPTGYGLVEKIWDAAHFTE